MIGKIGFSEKVAWIFHVNYSAVPLQDLALKIEYNTKLNHQVNDYDDAIAYVCVNLFSLTRKKCVIILYLENYDMQNGTFLSRVAQYGLAAILNYTLLCIIVAL